MVVYRSIDTDVGIDTGIDIDIFPGSFSVRGLQANTLCRKQQPQHPDLGSYIPC